MFVAERSVTIPSVAETSVTPDIIAVHTQPFCVLFATSGTFLHFSQDQNIVHNFVLLCRLFCVFKSSPVFVTVIGPMCLILHFCRASA